MFEIITIMRTRALAIILLMLAFNWAGAQDFRTLYGRVTDSEFNDPMYLASVTLAGSNISIVTNSDGVFSLKIPTDTKDEAVVRITYMGYDRVLLPVSSFVNATADRPLRIKMIPSVIALDAARITNLDADAMFDYAYRRIASNYPQDYEAMTAFYRETIMKNGSKYLSMNEAVLDISKAPYYSGTPDKAGIYKGRGSSNYDSSDSLLISYKGGVIGALTLDMAKNPFGGLDLEKPTDAHKYYDFMLGIPATIEDKNYYVIEFDQSPVVDYALYNGSIYIDPESYAITRVELNLNAENFPGVVADFIRKIPKNTRMAVESASFIVNYKEGEDGLWHYDYSRSEINISARKRYSPFKTRYSITSEMAVTDYYTGRLNIENDNLMHFGDIMSNKLEDFTDDNFWGSYNVIEPDKNIDVIIRRIVRQLRRRE